MDDLIVIILTLLVAGFGLWGQTRKRKQIAGDDGNARDPESLWDLLEKEMEEPLPASRFMGVEEAAEPVDVVPEQHEYRFEPVEEGELQIQRTREMENNNEPIKKKSREFSLKKAVIYSEILNGKYI